jgi:hypothetical protein
MYLDHRAIRQFEDFEGFDNIINQNIMIGKFLGFEPNIEYVVGTKESSCFHPKQHGLSSVNDQKKSAEEWLQDIREKYPDGWVVKEGNEVMKIEYYPDFHTDWDHLIEAIKRLEKIKELIPINTDIFKTWHLVVHKCK